MNEILVGDNLEILKTIESSSVDLIVTSPPYDRQRDYNGFPFYNLQRHRRTGEELFRVLKPNGVICWNIKDQTINQSETLTSFKQAIVFKKIGFRVETMIWKKNGFGFPVENRYYDQFEYVFILTKSDKYTFNPIKDIPITTNTKDSFALGKPTTRQRNGKLEYNPSLEKRRIRLEGQMGVLRKRGNVWIGNNAAQEKPCQKTFGHAPMPLWLARDLILSYSNPNDLVLDPFLGGGTTAVEAMELNRRWLGIEISPEIASEARTRLSKIQPALL